MLQPAIESAAGYPHGGVGASPLGEGGSDPLLTNTEDWCIPCVTAHLCFAFGWHLPGQHHRRVQKL